MKIEYKIGTYTKDQAGMDALNTDGALGWEIVFMVSDTTDYVFLLKRRYE